MAPRDAPTYGEHMAGALKTTVYLDADDYERLKEIARADGRAPAEVVREAVAEYTQRRRPKRTPKSLGAGHSRRGDVAERADELLAGFGRAK
jgi:predicted transcriptional regulator